MSCWASAAAVAVRAAAACSAAAAAASGAVRWAAFVLRAASNWVRRLQSAPAFAGTPVLALGRLQGGLLGKGCFQQDDR